MKTFRILTAIAICVFLVTSAPTPVISQESNQTSQSNDHDDNDADYGWIGLIGLAGLLGLRRRERDESPKVRSGERVSTN